MIDHIGGVAPHEQRDGVDHVELAGANSRASSSFKPSIWATSGNRRVVRRSRTRSVTTEVYRIRSEDIVLTTVVVIPRTLPGTPTRPTMRSALTSRT
jgi:hypothetical protein